MKKIIFLLILVVFMIGCREENEKWTSLDRGIVVNVTYQGIAGDFWNNPKSYTVITFKDERIVIYPRFVQRIHLNKCNEFFQHYWNNQIKAKPCQ